mgnify:CR=1 FL=1
MPMWVPPIDRPPAAKWATLIRELERGLSPNAAMGSAKFSPQVLFRWRVAANRGDKTAAEMVEEIDEAYARGRARYEELMAAGAEMDWRAASAELDRRDRSELQRERIKTMQVERDLLAVKLERERLELEQLREDLMSTTDGEGW